MDIFALVAAFGGGVFAAAIGALPAFILTGLIAIGGGLIGMAGISEFAVNNIAFGSFFGPHISFAGGVAAAAYAANKKKSLPSGGADITTSLFGLGDWSVLLVGGCFGIFGFLVCFLYGDILGLNTDLPGITVFTSAIIVRFLFGSTGLFGKYEGSAPRDWFPKGNDLITTLVIGASMGLITGGVGMSLVNQGISESALGMFPIVCFGISAFSLFFAQTGQATPGTHHMTITSATAFVMTGNVVIAVVVGALCSLLGDVIGRTFNSYCDSHIDPPAGTIFITMFILNAIFQ